MKNNPSVLLLGGHENTLAVARSLGDLGITVSVSTHRKSSIHYSRFCRKLYSAAAGEDLSVYWKNLLLEEPPLALQGNVILCCSDDAVEFVAVHHNELNARYVLEENLPQLQLALLDKYQTFLLAQKAGIDVPHCWYGIEGDPFYRGVDIEFPVLVKPLISHLYRRVFSFKLLLVETREQMEAHLRDVHEHKLEVMLTEYVPGPDSLLCSYYTYVDQKGECIFDFTKRVIRRFPKGFGSGCYHITEWLPDVAEIGRRFFREIGYRGLGNVEFKRDLRDNKLKLIECNPRFTGAHELLVRSGMSTDKIVYSRLTHSPYKIPDSFKQFERLLYPWSDFNAYRERRKQGEIDLWGWMRSIMYIQNFPFFRLTDPLPALSQLFRLLRGSVTRRLHS